MCLMYHGRTTFITSSKHCPKRVSQTFLDIASDLGLEQMIQFPTCGENTLDLIFTSHPSYQERCKSLPPISERSDHDIVLFDTAHQPVRSRPKRRKSTYGRICSSKGILWKQRLHQRTETRVCIFPGPD